MNNEFIISLASYGRRLNIVKETLESLLYQFVQPMKIVINIPKDHYANAPNDLKTFIDSNSIFELNLITEDLGPHNKYFTVFQKYKDYDIITVDDDYVYHSFLTWDLLKKKEEYPNSVIARSVHHLSYDQDNIPLMENDWSYFCTWIPKPSHELLAIGANGVLYPSEIIKKLNINDSNIEDIKNIFYGDDIYLKYLEDKNDIKVCYAPCVCMDCSLHKYPDVIETALYHENIFGGRNNEYMKLFPCTKRDNDADNKGGIDFSYFRNNYRKYRIGIKTE